MICLAWVETDGVRIDESRCEYRNGILQHALVTGLPVPRALNFSSSESAKMHKRALEYARSHDMADKQAVVVVKCKDLKTAKDAAMAEWHRRSAVA